ncbi:MAG: right-handed parallel beta-helix repeat-containing protein [Bacteroidota bacterium]
MLNKIPYAIIVRSTITIALLFIVVANSFAQTTRYVKPVATGTGDGSSWANASANLQAVITASVGNDSVFVMKGTYKPASTVSFSMKSGVKIYGSFSGTETKLAERVFGSGNTDTTVLKSNGGPVINCSFVSLSAVLDGFCLKDGYSLSSDGGGGISIAFASPTIRNCRFIGNYSTSYGGGGISNTSSSPSITDCIFISNSANMGGAIYNTSSSPTIIDCIFISNSGNTGGAIHNASSSKPFIYNCTFINNSAKVGGGTYNTSSSQPYIESCIFTSNAATNGNGGGIYNINTRSSNEDCTIIYCVFTNNTANNAGFGGGGGGISNRFTSSPAISNCSFTGNSATNGGGILNDDRCSPAISNCLFVNNSGTKGGGIYNLYLCVPLISNCTFTNNSINNAGGTIHNVSTANPSIKNCIISGNSTSIVNVESTPVITYSLVQGLAADVINHNVDGNTDPMFVDAVAGNYKLLACSPAVNAGNNTGISQYLGTEDLATNNRYVGTIDMGAFEYQNTGSPTVGNNIISASQSIPANTVPATLTGSTPTGGTGNYSYTWQSSTTNDSTGFTNISNSNTSSYSPPALSVTTWFRRVVSSPNTCPSISAAVKIALPFVRFYVKTISAGGSDANNGKTWATAFATIEYAINIASAGDTVFVRKGIYQPAADTSFILKDGVKIYGSFAGNETTLAQRLFGNTAADSSSLTGNNRTVVNNSKNNLSLATLLDGFIITGGKAYSGAGMTNVSSSPTISNCIFTANAATWTGGGISNDHSSPIISNCRFSKNTTDYVGAGIYNTASSPNITNCSFIANASGYHGGGIFNTSASSSPVITNCSFTGNMVTYNGAGIYNSSISSAIISNCSFTANATGDNSQGGGIYNEFCNATISNCSFTENITGIGGGICNRNTPSLTISNCSFFKNKTMAGGGIFNSNGSPVISNCSFYGNTASYGEGFGGGVFNYGAFPQIKNCIVYGNMGGVADSGTSVSNISYSLIQGMAADALKYNLNGNTDPLFIDTTNNDLRLLFASPCINAGDSAGVRQYLGTTDLAGNFRYISIIDMGAYEAAASVNTIYKFIGNGNWTNAANWQNSSKPPAQLPSGAQIIVAGNAVLDTPQTILHGASITVQSGYKLSIPLNLTIQ